MNSQRTTHDEEKVERQRQADRDIRQRDLDEERSRQKTNQDQAADQPDLRREEDPKERDRLLVEKPFDFIERTRPEDPTGERRQLTRDNVNPAIPSVSPEDLGPPHQRIPNPGGIVDPNTLGMEQATGGPEPRVESPLPPDPSRGGEQSEKAARQGAAGKEAPPLPDATPDQLAARLISPNEPWGSDVGGGAAEPTPPGGETGGGGEPLPLDLTGLNPDHGTIGTPVLCAVHGTGFTADCVVIIDDEEVPATFVNPGKFTVDVPMAEEPGTVDVEVGRGEEFSDVLTFEWVAAAGGTRKSEKAERKPKKVEPVAKRDKKKGKGRK